MAFGGNLLPPSWRRELDLERLASQFLFVFGIEKDGIAIERQQVLVAFLDVGQVFLPPGFLKLFGAGSAHEIHGAFANGRRLFLAFDVHHLEFGSADVVAILHGVHEGLALQNADERFAVVGEFVAVCFEHLGVGSQHDLFAGGADAFDFQLVGRRAGGGGRGAGAARELDLEQIALELIAHLGFFVVPIDRDQIRPGAFDLGDVEHGLVGLEVVNERPIGLDQDLGAFCRFSRGFGGRCGRNYLFAGPFFLGSSCAGPSRPE